MEDYPAGIVEALRGVEKSLKEAEDMLDYLLRKLSEEEALIRGVFQRQLFNIQAMGNVAHHTADTLEENFEAQRMEKVSQANLAALKKDLGHG
jgi:adenine C2-methylase RlmN of 23S rRNA A2503 and tRNA A37